MQNYISGKVVIFSSDTQNYLSITKFDIHLSQGMREQIKLLSEPLELCYIPHSDLRPTISTYIKSLWQHDWDENLNSKLHDIIPSVGGPPHSYGGRWDQLVRRRCRIGHSWLTHAFLVKGEPPLSETIKHFAYI